LGFVAGGNLRRALTPCVLGFVKDGDLSRDCSFAMLRLCVPVC